MGDARDPNEWRFFGYTAVFMVTCSGGLVLIGAAATPIILSVGAVPIAFMSGYFFRQKVIDDGKCPRASFLRMIGDCEDGIDSG